MCMSSLTWRYSLTFKTLQHDKFAKSSPQNFAEGFFLYKTNKEMHRKPGVKCFVHSWI